MFVYLYVCVIYQPKFVHLHPFKHISSHFSSQFFMSQTYYYFILLACFHTNFLNDYSIFSSSFISLNFSKIFHLHMHCNHHWSWHCGSCCHTIHHDKTWLNFLFALVCNFLKVIKDTLYYKKNVILLNQWCGSWT